MQEIGGIIRSLEGVQRRARLLLLVGASSRILLGALGWVALVVLLDFLVRFPAPVRGFLLLVGVALLVASFVRLVAPAWSFRPGLVRLALRAERLSPALDGRLASGVQFAMDGIADENPLAREAIRRTEHSVEGVDLDDLLRPRATRRIGVAALAALAAAVLVSIAAPSHASIGLRRALLPFSEATWPARTGVRSEVPDGVLPRGLPVPLAATLELGDPADTRVVAEYRVQSDDGPERWREVVLSRQADRRFERLIEAEGEWIDVRFRTVDSVTPTQRIRLIEPPAVSAARIATTPPEYAKGVVEPIERELGPGTDARGSLRTPILAGSDVTMTFDLTSDVREAAGDGSLDVSDWLGATFGPFGESEPTFSSSDDSNEWTLAFTATESVGLDLSLEDDFGLRNLDEIRYSLPVISDREPGATLLAPASDESVLRAARIAISAEARDDVGLASLAIESVLVRGAERGEPVRIEAEPGGASDRRAIETSVDLAAIDAQAGDVIEIVAIAQDLFGARTIDGAEVRPAARSVVRRLRVIGETEFLEQVREALSGVRRSAIRLEDQQGDLQDRVRAEEDPLPASEQARIGERLAAARDALREIDRRLARTGAENDLLRDVVRQADDLLREGARASAEASTALDEAQEARERANESTASPEERAGAEERVSERREAAEEAQQSVRDELGDLIGLLDRDEDAWVVAQQLESLAEELEQLASQTSELSDQTLGRDRSELTPEELAALDELADRQAESAQQAEETIDALRERSNSLERTDPERAAALREAAQRGEEQELAEELREAAESLESTRTNEAQDAQRAAQNTVSEMLEAMQEDRRARAEQLARRLESLVQSIERLVVVNEETLNGLALAIDALAAGNADPLGALAAALPRFQRNTTSVADEARAAGVATARIARLVDRAALAQGEAIGALRRTPVDEDGATERLQTSLSRLREALELARESQEQAEEAAAREQRVELRGVYEELGAKQRAIVESTTAIAPEGEETLSRRARRDALRLAIEQEDVRARLETLVAENPEFGDSILFAPVHELIDEWSVEVRDALREPRVDAAVVGRERAIADALDGLAAALADPPNDDDPFAENEGDQQAGGGGGGGGGQQEQGLLPPIAELRLLRAMQDQVYRGTRELDESGVANPARQAQLAELQGRLSELGLELLEFVQQQAEQQGGGN